MSPAPKVTRAERKITMMVKDGYIDFKNPATRNYYNIKEQFTDFLAKNNLSLFIDEDEGIAIVYDSDGNDLERMTLKQLSRRVRLA